MSSGFSVDRRSTNVGHLDGSDEEPIEARRTRQSSSTFSSFGSSGSLWGLRVISQRPTGSAPSAKTHQDKLLSQAIKDEKTGDQDNLYWTRHFLRMGANPELVLSEPGIGKQAENAALTALLGTDKGISASYERSNYDMLRAALRHCDNPKEKIGELVEKAYREKKSDILFGLIRHPEFDADKVVDPYLRSRIRALVSERNEAAFSADTFSPDAASSARPMPSIERVLDDHAKASWPVPTDDEVKALHSTWPGKTRSSVDAPNE